MQLAENIVYDLCSITVTMFFLNKESMDMLTAYQFDALCGLLVCRVTLYM